MPCRAFWNVQYCESALKKWKSSNIWLLSQTPQITVLLCLLDSFLFYVSQTPDSESFIMHVDLHFFMQVSTDDYDCLDLFHGHAPSFHAQSLEPAGGVCVCVRVGVSVNWRAPECSLC